MSAEIVYSVSDFQAVFNQVVETAFSGVLIEGEVSGFKVNQGRFVFFDLRDEKGAVVNCFMMLWQMRFPLEDGMRVRIRANLKMIKTGRVSLTVTAVKPVGEGSIKRSFELLKAKLEKEGLFSQAKKRALPDPLRLKNVAVISSVQAAGYADFVKILNERWGGLVVHTAHTQVQGQAAVEQIKKALDYFNERGEAEVIAIIRGGGSADDLAIFNDESLVRKVAASKIPVITGIGHEVDESLVDLAADVAASTPSNVAQKLTPEREAIRRNVQASLWRAGEATKQELGDARERVRRLVSEKGEGLKTILARKQERVLQLKKLAENLNPQKILARGFALIRGEIKLAQNIEIETMTKLVQARVQKISDKENYATK